MIEITIPGPPVGKGRARATRTGRLYTPQKTREHEGFIRHLAALAMQGHEQLKGAVSARIEITVQPPLSWAKRKRAAALGGEVHPVGKPDLDNIAKAILDACNGIVFLDDRQVVALRMSKRYADRDCTTVSFLEVA